MNDETLVQRAIRLLSQPIETVKAKEALKQQKALDQIPIIQAGDRIIWTRGDGTTQAGLVDFIHVDADGTTWAFITLGESWAAVNLKFVSVLPAE